MNSAMSSLSEAVGQDVPTLNEVRDKIEARYAKAKGMAELTESSVESRMLEVEQASMNSEAQARLFGGKAGQPFDPCYHKACDTSANIAVPVLDEMADALTAALDRLASP